MKQKRLGISILTAIVGISGMMIVVNNQAQAQGAGTRGEVQGVPDRVEYLRSLNFFATEGEDKYVVKTTLYAAPGTQVPTLLASGTVTVGSGNVNTGSSFIGGGRGNRATAHNSVIVGGAENEIYSENGLIL